MSKIDAVRLNFSRQGLLLLNVSLGVIMFGVALNLTSEDFKRLVRSPRPALVGVCSQFPLLPAVPFLLVRALRPPPSIALGMILAAAFPGGTISNLFDGLGGMAMVAAWWGVWHIVSGLALSFYWRSRPVLLPNPQLP